MAISETAETAETEALAGTPGWVCARAPIPSHSWRTLGVLSFPEHVVAIEHVVAGAIAPGVNLDDVDVWCPAVRGAWVALSYFGIVAREAALRGPCAIWARNRGPVDCEVDVRFKVGAEVVHPKVYTSTDATASYYASRVWRETFYKGIQILKCPLDLWIMQEILHEVRPDLVIETGTFKGGSALWFADMIETLGIDPKGTIYRVMSIDTDNPPERQKYDIRYIKGSSTDEDVLDVARIDAQRSRTTLVVLDSDHSVHHVAAELRAYGPLVTPGSYMVVEDTNTPGPAHAVADFLASPEGRDFEADRSREKFGTTFNQGGWLRKKGGAS